MTQNFNNLSIQQESRQSLSCVSPEQQRDLLTEKGYQDFSHAANNFIGNSI